MVRHTFKILVKLLTIFAKGFTVDLWHDPQAFDIDILSFQLPIPIYMNNDLTFLIQGLWLMMR